MSIPRCFDRNKTTKIPARSGWVYVVPLAGGRFRISASGRRAETVDAMDAYSVVREIVDLLGGTASRSDESAKAVVDQLLEHDFRHPDQGEQDHPEHWGELENDPDDPVDFVGREVAKRSEPIHKLEIEGRRWWRRGAGGTYCTARIYINDKLVHTTPVNGGSGDMYLTRAKDWLIHNGYIDLDHREPIWYLRDKQGINLLYHAYDVSRERDL